MSDYVGRHPKRKKGQRKRVLFLVKDLFNELQFKNGGPVGDTFGFDSIRRTVYVSRQLPCDGVELYE